MLTLSRGGPIVWISETDAKKAGIADNDWIEAYNARLASQFATESRVLVVDDVVANVKLLEARLSAEYFEVKTTPMSSFEVPSSTHWRSPSASVPFAPNWFVDVSDFLETKLEALAAYEEELRPWPHPRSIEGVRHLARWHGAGIGVQAAEAFCLERHVQ